MSYLLFNDHKCRFLNHKTASFKLIIFVVVSTVEL